jgi:hypothetical protein
LSTLQSLIGLRRTFRWKAVKAEDLSTEEFAVEDDESSMEEPEVKLGGEGLLKRDKSVTEVGRGGQLSAG